MNGEARAFGTAVHEGLEFMYQRLTETGTAPTEKDYKDVHQRFIDSGIENQLSDQSLYDEGHQLLKVRLDNYDTAEKVDPKRWAEAGDSIHN